MSGKCSNQFSDFIDYHMPTECFLPYFAILLFNKKINKTIIV